MITIELLEGEDPILPTDWVRQTTFTPTDCGGEGGANAFSTYGGGPINNTRWIRASDFFGDCWMGKSLASIQAAMRKLQDPLDFEVVRGEMPKSHVWDWRKTKSQREV